MIQYMNGILATIKKTLGIPQDDSSFDVDILLFINTNLAILSQLGIKEADATPIVEDITTWDDLLGERKDLECVKTFIHFKTKMMFDPPTNSAGIEAINRIVAELEWRIANVETNKGVMTNE